MEAPAIARAASALPCSLTLALRALRLWIESSLLMSPSFDDDSMLEFEDRVFFLSLL
jgi:hypothetical protein